MTGPGPIADPPSEVAQIAASAIRQLSLDPQALGISWNLRIATVASANPLYAQFDGDLAGSALAMTSMVGPCGVGQRVYVLIVPPSGNFIVGFADEPLRAPLDEIPYTVVGTTASSSGGTEVATTWTSQPAMTFGPGRLFKFTLNLGMFGGDTTPEMNLIRIRQGIGTTGRVLAVYRADMPGIAGQVQARVFIGYFKNATASSIVDQLDVTNQYVIGGTGSGLYGDTTIPMMLAVETYGLIVDHTNLSTISVSLA